jgi:hypothetical protein
LLWRRMLVRERVLRIAGIVGDRLPAKGTRRFGHVSLPGGIFYYTDVDMPLWVHNVLRRVNEPDPFPQAEGRDYLEHFCWWWSQVATCEAVAQYPPWAAGTLYRICGAPPELRAAGIRRGLGDYGVADPFPQLKGAAFLEQFGRWRSQ